MAKIENSVGLGGFIAPNDSADTYATHDEQYGRGGFRSVADLTDRDAIPADRRKEGMEVKVLADGKKYELVGGTANANWQEVVTGVDEEQLNTAINTAVPTAVEATIPTVINPLLATKASKDSIYETISSKDILFATALDSENKEQYSADFCGFACHCTYKDERFRAILVWVAVETPPANVILKLRDQSMDKTFASVTKLIERNGWNLFIFNSEIDNTIITQKGFYLTLETEDKTIKLGDPHRAVTTGATVPTDRVSSTTTATYRNRYMNKNVQQWAIVESNNYHWNARFISDRAIRVLQENTLIGGKEIITPMSPSTVYTVTNDKATGNSLLAERHNALALYVEYMVKKPGIFFKDADVDKFYFTPMINDDGSTINGGETVLNTNIDIDFVSDRYQVNSVNVTQKATKMSVTPTTKPKILCIGDSVTRGLLTEDSEGNYMPYWAHCQKFFALEDIDYDNDSSRIPIFVGAATSYAGVRRTDISIDYKNTQKTVVAGHEGRGTWTLYGYMRHNNNITFNQATWDALGLGDSSGTDFTNSLEQRTLMAQTPSVSTEDPSNSFFDNDKEGNIKFSIAKWLSRYRTMDDSGNRLTWGDASIGSWITETLLPDVDVCTPTHIVIQLGHNDFGKRSLESYHADMLAFITEIKTQLPDVTIILSLNPPLIGLMNNELYPKYKNIPKIPRGDWWSNAQYWVDYFNGYDEAANKVFLLPTYFCTPTAEAFKTMTIKTATDEYKKILGAGASYHPNTIAHHNWGYQLYALLKYISTL